jgi:predicted DNA-binding transcriptional regulator AlpA
MSIRPVVVDWKGLKRLGWPLSRSHTWRLMYDPDYEVIRFPRCFNLGSHRNSRPVWRVKEVLAYLDACGLCASEDWNAP